jgi:hypothetical protein
MAAIALHDPEKLYARNRGALNMSAKDLHDFASTSEKGLRKKASARKNKRKKK